VDTIAIVAAIVSKNTRKAAKLCVVVTVDAIEKKQNQQTTKIYLMEHKKMAKMRIFKFWNEAGDEKEKESLSLKKAVMSVQGDYKDKMISVEYITKKGKKIAQSVKIPMGRKIRQSILQEQRRLALKAKNASR